MSIRFIGAVVVLWVSTSAAQSAVRGRVVDRSGAPVAGAAVAAAGTSVVSDSAGAFAFEQQPEELRVTAPGFVEARVRAPFQPEVLVVLEIDAVKTNITVDAEGGYATTAVSSATRTLTALEDIPQSISVVVRKQMDDQLMMSLADVVRYVPGITSVQGENNRDQLVIRGNNTSADFFVNGVRDDVQYYRDLYNLERVEALKGPNAMVFGRGGGGGVVNRVTKEALFAPFAALTLTGGSFADRRAAVDAGQTLGRHAAWRLNGMYQDSATFRDFGAMKRRGLSPTVTIGNGGRSRLLLSFEHFRDHRTADRGVPSVNGRPVDVPIQRFFGNPDQSRTRARVNMGSALYERQLGTALLRSRTVAADYDKWYQNFVPGAVSVAATNGAQLVSISGYNSATVRRNLFNQTDVTGQWKSGRLTHQLLAGGEMGRQRSDNFRSTGYWGNSETIRTPLSDGRVRELAVFRQSASDADNQVRAGVVAGFVQDQVQVSRRVLLIGGVRADRVDIHFDDRRTAPQRRRTDTLISPRAGVVVHAARSVSVYGSYSVSWLPASGDQFAALTSVTEQLKPEKFTNLETGVKWLARRGMSLTAAVYQLDRTNTRSIDPADATRIVQTGSQRSKGLELGFTGPLASRWHVTGGYSLQNVEVTRATAAATLGAQVGQTPRHSFAMWNLARINRRLEIGLGVTGRSSMFAAIDNTVVLPGYARVDGGVFLNLTERMRLQANVENIAGRRYFADAHNNTNITPGSPLALRLGLTVRF